MSDVDELREHFAALREADLARTPSFAEVLARRSIPQPASRTSQRWLLAGGLGALAAASLLSVVAVQRRREAAFLDAAAAMSRWQPPTDALLRLSNRGPIGDPAMLRGSVLDSLIPASRED